ncbi:MAG: 50S ribosomal protein L30 [Thermoproteota archaeon]|nr:50S ribosomal protein L30 [Thermoproteota archaeon]
MALLVVRIRGTVNLPYWANMTLRNLNLEKKFTATIVPDTPVYIGMLKKIAEMVAWSKADSTIVNELFIKRARKKGSIPVSDSDVPNEYENIEGLVRAIAEDRIKISELKNVLPFFRLNPPKGGFKRKTKKAYSDGGILGRNRELPDLVRRML